MGSTPFEVYLARLTKRREQLLMTLRHLDDEQKTVERNTDWVDEAAFDSRIALLDGLHRDYQTEMTKIDRALDRIVKREYGRCEACHGAIDPKRLELLPEAEYCYGCESFREGLEQYAA